MDRTQYVLTATLRSNPHYELVAFDRLSPSEQALLGPLAADADFHGVLRPRSADTPLPIKAVSHDTARLVRALETPGMVPTFAEPDSSSTRDAARSIARLVLDDVLEVAHDDRFVGGVAAAPFVLTTQPPSLTTTVTSRLSLAALRYASALRVDDPLALSARMYFFNRMPVTPQWRRRHPDSAAIAAVLGVDAAERTTLGPAGWTRSTRVGSEREGWFQWRRATSASRSTRRETLTYKLYVSPRHESLRDVVHATLPILARSPATAFKVGSTEQQLCRPDKLVAYFDSRAALDDTAATLDLALRGAEAHGVPFTASVTDDGLLSWGVDPPPAPQVMWRENESWRLWVTNRLAIALLSARRAPQSAMSPAEFAVVRLELDGVDISTWAPDLVEWSGDESEEG
jgi:hypothetical protein